ncbi:Serine palmitoyltransferase small subunit B [Lonchura striata]|uniref:Serine palmitoyltransferase small subunit B n=2 Tax=Lonchura striata TaxID=40157 RepID=A0A218UEB4_9PASE|nr:Serine palmitoyltransferase small subunit B [Lonchura striata domestica]
MENSVERLKIEHFDCCCLGQSFPIAAFSRGKSQFLKRKLDFVGKHEGEEQKVEGGSLGSGMDVKNTPSYLYWLFCQFELITCSYLMEPWEKVLFYSFNLAMLGLLLYTTYVCLAFHTSSAFQLLCSFLGNPRENSLSVVK